MDDKALKELDRLVNKRVDPRRGVSQTLGTIRWGLGGAFSVLYVLFHLTPMTEYAGLAMLVMAFGVIACWLIPIQIRRSTKERAKRHENFLCPWCRYALTSLPDEGTCPECGARYKRSVCVMLYQCAYREYQPSGDEIMKREREAWTEAIEMRDQSMA